MRRMRASLRVPWSASWSSRMVRRSPASTSGKSRSKLASPATAQAPQESAFLQISRNFLGERGVGYKLFYGLRILPLHVPARRSVYAHKLLKKIGDFCKSRPHQCGKNHQHTHTIPPTKKHEKKRTSTRTEQKAKHANRVHLSSVRRPPARADLNRFGQYLVLLTWEQQAPARIRGAQRPLRPAPVTRRFLGLPDWSRPLSGGAPGLLRHRTSFLIQNPSSAFRIPPQYS